MNMQDFQAKWRNATLKERTAAQEHFTDLCRALDVPTPAERDPAGSFYTFERAAAKTTGGQGFADVWYRGHFAWEYKGRGADLHAAYVQLLQYREDLANPPLLIVCDLNRFEVHTNFTDTIKQVYRFTLDDLDQPTPIAPSKLSAFGILRAVFTEPNALRPGQTVQGVTEQVAARFGDLALALHRRGIAPQHTAHYLVQLLFCLFAEDIGLLPRGLFTRLVTSSVQQPERFTARIEAFFTAMRDGGDFGAEQLRRFNGGLFRDIAVVALTGDELASLARAGELD